MSVQITTEDPRNLPEVLDYEQAKAILAQFKLMNAPFMEQLEALVEQYNQRREAAEKAVRARGVSCGDFDLYQAYEKPDGQALLNALGREAFIGIGGTIITSHDAKIEAKQVQVALARGIIDQPLYDEVTSIVVRYHLPREISTP